ncbi:hypothetical protein NQ317_017353 [Molorchus minor]|uniref:Uncharacterized protein n=1 Tax=Molorchus minor TaxID=1323400 RepID=A0ABQ9ISG5_9CUCU|nr:hypothetical protein NQ317_017353 [Molorchus minor]
MTWHGSQIKSNLTADTLSKGGCIQCSYRALTLLQSGKKHTKVEVDKKTQPAELYQPQGGITYYSTDQQVAQRPARKSVLRQPYLLWHHHLM